MALGLAATTEDRAAEDGPRGQRHSAADDAHAEHVAEMTDETRRELHTTERRSGEDRRTNWRRATDLQRRDNASWLLRDLDQILGQLKEDILELETDGKPDIADGLVICRTRVADALDQYRRSAS